MKLFSFPVILSIPVIFSLAGLWGADFNIEDSIPASYQGADFRYPVDPEKILYLEFANLNDGQTRFLCQNGFVVVPGNSRDFYCLYDGFKYDSVPVYVTADAMLHTYHLIFNKIIRDLEDEFLRDRLLLLTVELCAEAKDVHSELRGTQFEDAALDVWTYFEIARFLLDEKPPALPLEVMIAAQYEIEKISEAQGIDVSTLMTEEEDIYEEDYSQYRPRGHYDGKPERERYFRAMMWYGRISFSTDDLGDIRRIIVFADIMSKPGNDYLKKWQEISEPIEYFVGKSKDISVVEAVSVFRKIYGDSPDKSALVSMVKGTEFLTEIKKISKGEDLPFEYIESDPGFRFMGQKYVFDSHVYEKLVYSEVGTPSNTRMLPKALDLFAVFGSEEAYGILESEGDTEIENYSENMEKLKALVSRITPEKWQSDVYTYWLCVLKTYVREKDESYPKYMRKLSWTLRNLYAALASYTELKHDTVLYANQVMAECGDDIPYEKYICHVEPDPEFFYSLLKLVELTEKALEKTGVELETSEGLLANLEEETGYMASISLKELRGEELSREDFDRLYYFGGWLEWMVFESADDPAGNPDWEWAGLVTDIATDPNGRVLQEATGKIFKIFVITQGKEGRPQLAGGGVYSYYEFPWPMDDRLTDSKWRKMLLENSEPPRPEWSGNFIIE